MQYVHSFLFLSVAFAINLLPVNSVLRAFHRACKIIFSPQLAAREMSENNAGISDLFCSAYIKVVYFYFSFFFWGLD